jgi:hypothetical protein
MQAIGPIHTKPVTSNATPRSRSGCREVQILIISDARGG